MFTGIVTHMASLVSLEKKREPLLTIDSSKSASIVKIGDSLAVNGVCLTAVEIREKRYLSFHLTSETLKKTNFADLHPGNLLNLEFPLKLNEFLGGHWVTGHIDGMVRVRQVQKGSGRNRFAFSYSTRDWEKYLFPKGSVTLNGISLTLVEVHPTWFSVEVIPHTLRTTNLATVRIGQRMNLELDFLGKTLYNLIKSRLDGPK